MKNSVMYNDWVVSDKTLVMFGSEAKGLSEELQRIATTNLTIEMSKDVESLNLSISAGIVMHKLGC